MWLFYFYFFNCSCSYKDYLRHNLAQGQLDSLVRLTEVNIAFAFFFSPAFLFFLSQIKQLAAIIFKSTPNPSVKYRPGARAFTEIQISHLAKELGTVTPCHFPWGPAMGQEHQAGSEEGTRDWIGSEKTSCRVTCAYLENISNAHAWKKTSLSKLGNSNLKLSVCWFW